MKFSKVKQFFINWNGGIILIPALILFGLTKLAIFYLTDGQEQGYFWSQLHVISFGFLKAAAAELGASAFLYWNAKEAFTVFFKKLPKEELIKCSYSRNAAIDLYTKYFIGCCLVMAFA